MLRASLFGELLSLVHMLGIGASAACCAQSKPVWYTIQLKQCQCLSGSVLLLMLRASLSDVLLNSMMKLFVEICASL